MMRFSLRMIVWMGAVTAMPLAGSSCGRSACLLVSPAEMQKNGGTCPTMNQALHMFNDGCGKISSVEGPGVVDGQLCCYPVVQSDHGFDCIGGFGGFGEGGFGGFGE